MSRARWIDGVALGAATGRVLTITLALAAVSCRVNRPELELPFLPEASAPRELTADQQIKQALSRLTFGARPHEAQELTGHLDVWLQRQLTPAAIRDHAADSMLAAHPLLTRSAADLVAESPPLDIFLRRRKRELGLADTAHYIMTTADSARFKVMNDLGNRRVQEILGARHGGGAAAIDA